MRLLRRSFSLANLIPPGLLAGWLGLGLVALGPRSVAAQGGKTDKTRIVNIATATAHNPAGELLQAADTFTAAYASGSSGTTLIASDTVLTICARKDGNVTVSGYVTVTNGGAMPTQNLTIAVRVQIRSKNGKYVDVAGATQTIIPTAQLMPGQTQQYPYSITFKPPSQSQLRVVAQVTITDHSSHLGTPYGPEPSTVVPPAPYPACLTPTLLGVEPLAVKPVWADAEPVRLTVKLEAGRLEARTGEAVPMTATIQNSAGAAVSAPVVRIFLPASLAFVRGSASGADSVRTLGDRVEVFLPGELAAGASTTLRFQVAVVGTGSAEAAIRLSAGSLDGRASSDMALAAVQTQRNRASETRAVLGKVWLDRNGNGRQDEGEEGVARVDVWTADGNIATTDSAGKFSFPELRLGAHVMRVDPATLTPEYGVPESARSGVSVQVDGWTTPHVLLPLVPRGALVQDLHVAVRPLFLDPRFCVRARDELAPDAPVPTGCGAVQVASTGNPVLGPRTPEIDVTLTAPGGGSEVSYRIPNGWRLVREPIGLPERGPRPRSVLDRAGHDWVVAKVDPRRGSAVVRLRPVGADAPGPVRVAPVRDSITSDERKRREILWGPGVRIFEPADGKVFGTDRIYVGVRGEPGAVVTLFDGPSQIAKEGVRIDGQLDFVAIKLAAGPHLLRARMTNSWNKEQWDSVHVHVSGPPATLMPEHDALALPADARVPNRLRVRVLDRWDVPVVNRPYATVEGKDLGLEIEDADASSVGLQVRADTLGWLEIAFSAPREVANRTLALSAGRATAKVALEFVTPVRPLIIVGSAQLGFGAARRAEGAMTVRGNLDEKTSLTVSIDSRGRDPSNPRFGGTTDPLGEGVMPVSGDQGEHRTVSSYDSHVSVRMERDRQWAAYGDMQIGRAFEGLTLLRHDRSLRGITARLKLGGVEWSGFGALTNQSLRQVQLRGAGTSGPYELGGSILLGTEQVNLEVRDALNAQHVLSRQRLTAYVDYEIDHERGVLLLKQPLPAMDLNGNPLFLVVSYEGRGAGAQRGVWGLRARRNFLGGAAEKKDSLAVGLTYVRDDQVALGGLQLFGSDVRLTLAGKVGLRAEVLYVERRDSSDVAFALEGSVNPWKDRLTLDARWSSTGREFRNPADLSLVAGTSDLRVGATARVLTGRVRLEHSSQSFGAQGTGRERTTLAIMQPLGFGLELESTMADDRALGGTTGQRSGVADTKLAWRPGSHVRLWAETRRRLWSAGLNQPFGDHIGGGASLTLFRDLSLEARHLRVTASDTLHYSLTEVGLRSSLMQGSRAWGTYQVTGGLTGASDAAVVGMNNRFNITPAWSINTLFERRTGLQHASPNDPVRALPLPQADNDYWSGGLGLELSPKGGAYHATFKSEMKNGTRETTRLLVASGDLMLNRSVGLLIRQDFLARRWNGGEGLDRSRRNSSIWGLALRPAGSEAINGLVQLRWLEDANPASGGVLKRYGRERRLLASAEAIWAPVSRLELGARCATRMTTGLATDSMPALQSRALFCGGRYDLALTRFLVLRGESRMLREQLGGLRRWDFAPSLLLRTSMGLEIGGGYRLGDLADPDLGNTSGRGFFLTTGLRATEGTVSSLTDYWRARLGRD